MSQTVQRAIDILEQISDRPRTVAELADHLGVHRSTALRLLHTLADGGLARVGADGRYGVGLRLAGLAARAVEQLDLVAVARPRLGALQTHAHHRTVHLAVVDGDRIVYADKLEPDAPLRLVSRIGDPVCLHTAGVAKAVLAFLPPARRDALLAGHVWTRFTETTLTSRRSMLAALVHVRDRGWAVDDGERESWVRCVAAPVFGNDGDVIAAASITTVAAIEDLDSLRRAVPDLLDVTTAISKELGWRP